MPDVLIIGGGVIGLTTAWELAGRGRTVAVLDRQQPGQEASWAGAGILPPGLAGDPQHPVAGLSRAATSLWPDLTRQLLEQTGIDNGFRPCGGICFSPEGTDDALRLEIDDWRAAGVELQPLTRDEVRSTEPALGPSISSGYRLPGTCQLRNPRHLKALLSACTQRGVDVRSGQPVAGFEQRGDRVIAVRTMSDRFEADQFLVCAGAWTSPLLAGTQRQRMIEPVRGQMLLLSTPAPLLKHVIECGPRYIVARPDGRTLVGATEEWVGFEKRNTPAAMRGLMDFAIRMVPGLADARFEQAWSGFRPHSVDGLPLMGRHPDAENLFVAAGHFRAGLYLSPITARLMSQLMAGEVPDLNLTPFAP